MNVWELKSYELQQIREGYELDPIRPPASRRVALVAGAFLFTQGVVLIAKATRTGSFQESLLPSILVALASVPFAWSRPLPAEPFDPENPLHIERGLARKPFSSPGEKGLG